MILHWGVLGLEPNIDEGVHLYCCSSSNVYTEILQPENKNCMQHFQKQVSWAHIHEETHFLKAPDTRAERTASQIKSNKWDWVQRKVHEGSGWGRCHRQVPGQVGQQDHGHTKELCHHQLSLEESHFSPSVDMAAWHTSLILLVNSNVYMCVHMHAWTNTHICTHANTNFLKELSLLHDISLWD